jgi:hypothetical protein
MTANPVPIEQIRASLLTLLEETFEKGNVAYLDRGTSLFETLEGVDAETASRAVSSRAHPSRRTSTTLASTWTSRSAQCGGTRRRGRLERELAHAAGDSRGVETLKGHLRQPTRACSRR